jgi:hypothetical protein
LCGEAGQPTPPLVFSGPELINSHPALESKEKKMKARMSGKTRSLFNGNIRVVIPAGLSAYDAYEIADFPNSLKNSPDWNNYDWLGNYGIKDSQGKKVPGDMNEDYEIHVVDRPGKKLVYWNGSQTVEFTETAVFTDGGRSYRYAHFKLGDPPIGISH